MLYVNILFTILLQSVFVRNSGGTKPQVSIYMFFIVKFAVFFGSAKTTFTSLFCLYPFLCHCFCIHHNTKYKRPKSLSHGTQSIGSMRYSYNIAIKQLLKTHFIDRSELWTRFFFILFVYRNLFFIALVIARLNKIH